MTELVLYGYFRSSAAYRVRIALNHKGLPYRQQAVSLVKGEQLADSYLALNPQGQVPALQDGDVFMTQSLAICEYLEEAYLDTPRLLPAGAAARAKIRAMALSIACDIHPLNNLRVLGYLKSDLGASEESKNIWIRHWIGNGFAALEKSLAHSAGRYCVGDEVTLADVFLLPQVFNARRFDLDLTPFPHIVRIAGALEQIPAFAAAHPSKQPDFV